VASGIYLTLATVVLAGLVKAEALAYDKNLLVALLWGLLGVVYLEVARVRRSRLWLVAGHAVLLAGAVHLFLVNFVQLGSLGPLSLRAVTVLPYFAFVLYVYNTWQGTSARLELPTRMHTLRFVYLYLLAAIAATLVAYELHRAWVVVAWVMLALLMLACWRTSHNLHWRLCALALAMGAVARGIAVNLTFRDELAGWKLNLMTVPLACAGLLAGYVMIRRQELVTLSARGVTEARDLLATVRRHRIGWLLALVVLLIGFASVEASGAVFTVVLSVESLGLVGLGFAAKERIARLAGIVILGFCIIKLFTDLWGMEGVPRYVPFAVLGVVLIVVSFAYTRFKDRLQEIL
jgi:hypothetical protein